MNDKLEPEQNNNSINISFTQNDAFPSEDRGSKVKIEAIVPTYSMLKNGNKDYFLTNAIEFHDFDKIRRVTEIIMNTFSYFYSLGANKSQFEVQKNNSFALIKFDFFIPLIDKDKLESEYGILFSNLKEEIMFELQSQFSISDIKIVLKQILKDSQSNIAYNEKAKSLLFYEEIIDNERIEESYLKIALVTTNPFSDSISVETFTSTLNSESKPIVFSTYNAVYEKEVLDIDDIVFFKLSKENQFIYLENKLRLKK